MIWYDMNDASEKSKVMCINISPRGHGKREAKKMIDDRQCRFEAHHHRTIRVGGDHKTSNNGFLLSEEVQRQIPTVYDFEVILWLGHFFLFFFFFFCIACDGKISRLQRNCYPEDHPSYSCICLLYLHVERLTVWKQCELLVFVVTNTQQARVSGGSVLSVFVLFLDSFSPEDWLIQVFESVLHGTNLLICLWIDRFK